MDHPPSDPEHRLDQLIEHLRQQQIPPYPGLKVLPEPRRTESQRPILAL